MTSLKEEINNILYNNDDLDESLEQIIKVIEKRIDSIEPVHDMEYHCIAAVTYTKDKMKELLK